ncbi:MAG: tetratricopeptide repeat protein [Fuerstiella sp.]
MSQTSPNSHVRGGVPWWLWIMIVVVTVVIGFGTVISLMPEDPEALYKEASVQLQEKEMEAFAATLTRLKKHPDYASHVALLEGVEATTRDRDPLAIELFQKAQENESLKKTALQNLGTCYGKLGRYADALDTYREAVALDPDDADASRVMMAALYVNVGALFPAEDLLNQVLEGDPENRAARGMRGNLHMQLFRFEEAAADFSGLLKTPGDRATVSPDVLTGYLQCLIQTENREELQKIGPEVGPEIQDPLLKMRVQLETGDIDMLKVSLTEAKRAPDMAPPSAKIEALIALQEEKYALAAEAITQAAEAFPRDLEVFETAIQVFAKTGDQQKLVAAEENLRQLKDLQNSVVQTIRDIGNDIQNEEPRIQVALMLVRLGNINSAMRWLAVARLMAPERHNELDALIEKEVYRRQTILVPLTGSPAATPADSEDQTPTSPDAAAADDAAAGNDAAAGEKEPPAED